MNKISTYGGGCMLKIPLDTKFDYFACDHGFIWRGKIQLRGTKNCRPPGDKWYMRYSLQMSNGTSRLFYGQRLVAYAYHSLKEDESLIVRHLTADTFNNAPHVIAVGTHQENQTTDRMESGNYYNRGGKSDLVKNEEECPF